MRFIQMIFRYKLRWNGDNIKKRKMFYEAELYLCVMYFFHRKIINIIFFYVPNIYNTIWYDTIGYACRS